MDLPKNPIVGWSHLLDPPKNPGLGWSRLRSPGRPGPGTGTVPGGLTCGLENRAVDAEVQHQRVHTAFIMKRYCES
jgi:hypothetical protein